MLQQKIIKSSSSSSSDSYSENKETTIRYIPQSITIKKNEIKKYEENFMRALIKFKKAKKLEDPVFWQEDLIIDNVEDEENVYLNIFPRQHEIQLQESILPVVLQMSTTQLKPKGRVNIDIICVVDVSGSMKGEKLQLVQDSLRQVTKFLHVNDRISIVTFGSQAAINLPWTKKSKQNKRKIKQAILDMKIRDSTNISSGVGMGLKLIKERQYKNPVTCMFLLGDGKDDDRGADQRCQEALQFYNIQDTFSIFTFGYGADHDPKIMNSIANLKGGQFRFIDKFENVSDHFVLALGGILSVKAKNIKIIVESNNENSRIKKMFGDDYFWKKINNNYEMNINFVQNGEKREYALELELELGQYKEGDLINALQVTLSGEFIKTNNKFVEKKDLMISLTKNPIDVQLNEVVEINYLRGKSGDIIGQAKQLANDSKYDQAQQLLNSIIQQIENSPFKHSQPLIMVLKDLYEIKEVCKPSIFQLKGEALMFNKQRNHIERQKSITYEADWDFNEEELMNQFKNKRQLSCESMSNQEINLSNVKVPKIYQNFFEGNGSDSSLHSIEYHSS